MNTVLSKRSQGIPIIPSPPLATNHILCDSIFIKYKMRQNQCILQMNCKGRKYSGNANILPSPFAIPLVFRWLSALMHKALILLTLSLKDTQLRAFLNHAVYIVLLFCFCLQTPTYDNYVLFICVVACLLPFSPWTLSTTKIDMTCVLSTIIIPAPYRVPGMEKAFMLVRHFQTSN